MMLGYERRDMSSYRIPIIAAIIGIAALLTASFHTSASLDKYQSAVQSGSTGSGSGESGQARP